MEVFEVVCQSLLLLVDVEFLDVVNQFLLKTVLVVVYLRNLLETIDNLFSNLWYTILFKRFDALQKISDIVNLLGKLLLQCRTFLFAEFGELFNSLVDSLLCYFPFLVI